MRRAPSANTRGKKNTRTYSAFGVKVDNLFKAVIKNKKERCSRCFTNLRLKDWDGQLGIRGGSARATPRRPRLAAPMSENELGFSGKYIPEFVEDFRIEVRKMDSSQNIGHLAYFSL